MAAEHYESGNDDEDEDENLDRAKDVHHPYSPVGYKGVHAGGEGDDADSYPSLSPFSHAMVSCNQNVLGKYDTAGCCTGCQDGTPPMKASGPNGANE